MTVRIAALVIDANDPRTLAPFWAEALRWEAAGDGVRLHPTDGTPFGITFRPTTARKVAKNRIHLDLTTSTPEDQDETVRRLLELGARHVDVGQGPDAPHVVLADPEGNELCIIEPENNFLATCGRLGSVTCDGSRTTGVFWSEALRWPLVWDQDDETAVRARDGTGPFVTWGPPVPPSDAPARLHLELAVAADADPQRELARLRSLGASDAANDADADADADDSVVLLDPDGTPFRLEVR